MNPITLPQNSPNENFATISSQQSYRSIPSIVNTIIDQQGLPTQLNLPSQISSNLSNPNHPTFHDEFSLHLSNQISYSRSEPSLHSFPPQPCLSPFESRPLSLMNQWTCQSDDQIMFEGGLPLH